MKTVGWPMRLVIALAFTYFASLIAQVLTLAWGDWLASLLAGRP